MRGTVVNVLPATRIDPNDWLGIETTSLISVNEVLFGKLAPGTTTISMSQLGGRVEPCTRLVADDPVVKFGEVYVLFLLSDTRSVPPNTTGSPRYAPMGVWSGKLKITDGKIQFLPRASAALHKYDNTDATAFIATLKSIIDSLVPKKTR